jgi:murein L,D-transpeptidase YafK
MRYLIFLTFLFVLACSQTAQEKNNTMQNPENDFDEVIIDKVKDIPKGTNERSSSFIKKRLEALVGNFLKEKCLKNNVNYPPQFILFRFFKYEKEFEVWAGNSQSDSLKRILLLKVCAVDDVPGTKLEEGDGKTPEGFYNARLYYGSNAAFMWINLNNSEISTYGTVGEGSSFKMCLDYPNSLDRLKTKTVMKHNRPGSAICIHGNCVSIGCISFKNENYLPVYLAALGHNSIKYDNIKIHIFPFRFDNYTDEEKLQFSKADNRINSQRVLKDWANLQEAYELFNKERKALKFTLSKDKYSYSIY